ncbi:MAG TPA: hypothetical protein PKV33_07480 [Methanothrix sp.]|nr:hypothetical protein [Methanothrix sp.]
MNYSPSEGKRLSELEEARGVLLSAFCRDGSVIAGFAWGAVSFPEELESNLRELVGKEVCCLRLDGKYHLREA